MSDSSAHFRSLEQLYLTAPNNSYYRPSIHIGDSTCVISIDVRSDFHHAAHAVHGSVYFKLLDDAGFFAANSIVNDVFVLTANFAIYLIRPVSEGMLTAKGRLIKGGATQFICEAQLFNDRGDLLAHGTGTYVRSRIPLDERVGYRHE